jgi:hypothetical protein
MATGDGSHFAFVVQIFQMITPIAVTGGLVYTALQFRAYRKAQYVANFTKLVELQMQLRRMRVDNPRLARVHSHDVEGLNGEEEIQFYFLNLMQMSVFEIVWFSHRNGQLPDDYFMSWVNRMKKINAEESFRNAMRKSSTKIFHDQFEAYLRDLTRTQRAQDRKGHTQEL